MAKSPLAHRRGQRINVSLTKVFDQKLGRNGQGIGVCQAQWQKQIQQKSKKNGKENREETPEPRGRKNPVATWQKGQTTGDFHPGKNGQCR